MNLDDLVEGLSLGRFNLNPSMIMLVFEIAHQGDAQALEVVPPLGWPRAGNDGRRVLLTNSIFMLKHLMWC